MSIKIHAGSVLVIEQDHDTRVAIRRLLGDSFGLTVHSTADPLEGLGLIQKIQAPHFVLLSTALPTMTYEEFLEAKAKVDPKGLVPVVLLVNAPLTELPRGACSWVQLPLDHLKFAEAVAAAIGWQKLD